MGLFCFLFKVGHKVTQKWFGKSGCRFKVGLQSGPKVAQNWGQMWLNKFEQILEVDHTNYQKAQRSAD
jgi:hypothetical protein